MSDQTPEQRGAALLDDHLSGWADRVDTEALDIASVHHCVLSQVYAAEAGRYPAFLWGIEKELHLRIDEIAACGFDSRASTAEWVALITTRQTTGAAG